MEFIYKRMTDREMLPGVPTYNRPKPRNLYDVVRHWDDGELRKIRCPRASAIKIRLVRKWNKIHQRVGKIECAPCGGSGWGRGDTQEELGDCWKCNGAGDSGRKVWIPTPVQSNPQGGKIG